MEKSLNLLIHEFREGLETYINTYMQTNSIPVETIQMALMIALNEVIKVNAISLQQEMEQLKKEGKENA